MSLDQFSHESLQDAASIAAYLTALNEGFEKGQISLSEGDETLLLEPTGTLDMTIKATRSSGKCELVLTVAWSEPIAPTADAPSLTIESGD